MVQVVALSETEHSIILDLASDKLCAHPNADRVNRKHEAVLSIFRSGSKHSSRYSRDAMRKLSKLAAMLKIRAACIGRFSARWLHARYATRFSVRHAKKLISAKSAPK